MYCTICQDAYYKAYGNSMPVTVRLPHIDRVMGDNCVK